MNSIFSFEGLVKPRELEFKAYAEFLGDKFMKKLALFDAKVVKELTWPELEREIDMASPALTIFTDFRTTKLLILESNVGAVEAEKLMQKAHVRLKIVVGEDNNVLGIVSLQDLNSQEILIRIAQGEKREELSIVDFMRPMSRLKCLEYAQLSNASISNVVDALKDSDQQHCLVIDREKVRGIISASDIVRKLKLPINIFTDSSFSEIYRVAHH